MIRNWIRHDYVTDLDWSTRLTFLSIALTFLASISAECHFNHDREKIVFIGIPFYFIQLLTRTVSLAVLGGYLGIYFIAFIPVLIIANVLIVLPEQEHCKVAVTAFISILVPVVFFKEEVSNRNGLLERYYKRNSMAFTCIVQAFAVAIQIAELMALDGRYADFFCAHESSPLIACFARRSDGRALFVLILLGIVSTINAFTGYHVIDFQKTVFKKFFN